VCVILVTSIYAVIVGYTCRDDVICISSIGDRRATAAKPRLLLLLLCRASV